VRSARYAGEAGPRANTEKLLAALAHVPDAARAARFRCAIVVVHGARPGHPVVVQGSCEGSITRALRGAGGFGYDPVFELARAELESLGRSTRDRLTMAELDEGEKNLVSHRGRAVRALRARWGELEVLGRGGQ
jgi:XTP/dITP diphosphohydrolase